MEEYDFLFKCIVLGDGGCGKTALTVRFSQGYFQESYKMTVGVDFSVKLLEVAQKRAKLQIWDTGGQERFSFVRPLYYRGAMGALLVFDVTNRESFDHLANWVEELESNAGKVPFVLIGNKIDLPRVVSSDEAWAFCQQMGIPYYYETSAKTGEAVGDCFHGLTYAMMSLEMPPNEYPNVMKQLGAVPGLTAPTPAAAKPSLAVPQVQATPAATPMVDEFSGADEYADVEVSAPAPAPRPVAVPVVQSLSRPAVAPVPKPVAAPAPRPAVAPVPKPAAAPAPRPAVASVPKPAATKVQPLPKPQAQPVPRPVAAPSVQPLPKPTPIALSVPAAKPTPRPQPAAKPAPAAATAAPSPKPAARSMGLFSTAEDITEEPPVEMPELPLTKPAVPVRQTKPIPVAQRKIEEALPEIEELVPKPATAKPAAKPAAKTAGKPAAGPVLFATQPVTAQPATPASGKATPQPAAPKASTGSSTSSFLAALTAKSQSASPASSGSGAIPFSAGFTAKKQVGGSSAPAKPSGMSIFFQASIPEDLLHMKKQAKKAPTAAKPSPGGGVVGGASVAATSDVIKCPGCGYTVSSKMRFCNKCGTRLK